jgi:ABC-type Fe3+ transport system substrate-binding protein
MVMWKTKEACMGVVTILLLLFLPLAVLAQEKGWEEQWKETLLGAKKDGKVVVASSPDPVMRNEIIPKFTARFGIPVEFIAGRSSDISQRLKTEHRAGVYSIDIFMGGASTAATSLYPEKMVDPLRPLLVLPEVVDPTKWKKGKFWFSDPEEKYVLRVFSTVGEWIHINTEHVRPEEIRTARDLLHPKWRGKIATEDVTFSGRPQGNATRFLYQLGDEFIKKLYIDQKPAVSRDRRQAVDWLARGTYPICLSCRGEDSERLRKEGFKIAEIYELSDLKNGITSSPWQLAVLNNAPHPHAARIFANWIVSKEGLEIYSRGYGAVTLRTDVDESFLDPRAIPRPGVRYVDDHDWNWVVNQRKETTKRLLNLLKPR